MNYPKHFDSIRIIGDIDGRIVIRIYDGNTFIEGSISYGCNANLATDSSKMTAHILQKELR